ncbi:signal peptidase I SipW [Bacillus sp. FJAT-49736]|uniref:signal peptidase I SipW n=1 Tax=Bacillus sp. FJAT-49736 TaxID=2833582 RepID=UPI001BC922C3|nr:signal peptidase I [Bacillus sp. FJAT-49736]MBS4173358.1 signal peptidase I [Bacillus sp. FJAT-49736]
MKSFKIVKWISNIISIVLFLALIFMLFVVISSKASGGEPKFLGYELKTVLSGSMEPTFKTGSVIAVKPGGDMTRFQKGDVITFKADEKTIITHRIVQVDKSGNQVLYRTKGDNNKTADLDPVLSQNVIAQYTGFTIPYLGYFINFTQTKNGSALLLILPGILLLSYSIITIWRAISQIDNKVKNSQDSIEKSA